MEVVAGCLEGGRGTAEVMAGLASLRGAAAAERASVSSWATRVLGARLRVERALATSVDIRPTQYDASSSWPGRSRIRTCCA